MEHIQKLNDFLRKDSGGQNESTKLRYVLRIVLCLIVFYNFCGSVCNSIFDKAKGVLPFATFFFLFTAVFIASYFIKKTVSLLVLTHGCILLWIFSFIKCYGWGIGFQALIILCLVMGFFSGYRYSLYKIIYAVFLLVFRIFLFYFSELNAPIFEMSESGEVFYQSVNSIFSFLAISVLCYIYSKDSQMLEGKLVEYNIQLVNQANTDPLTGLNNRRRTMEYLESLTNDFNTNALSVTICDIDFFKKVNDSYGHDIGDKVLKSIAQTMISTLGDKAFISRWGGEEFLIVFPGINGDDAYVLLQKLVDEIAKLTFEVKDRSFKVTLTYGLCEYDFRSDIQSFIKEADSKLYLGKENGRNQVVF